MSRRWPIKPPPPSAARPLPLEQAPEERALRKRGATRVGLGGGGEKGAVSALLCPSYPLSSEIGEVC